MAWRDLTNEEIEQMGIDNPGSAAEYLRLRREELEEEKQAERELEDRERYVERFVAAGGTRTDALAERKRLTREQAAEAARTADQDASASVRRHVSQSL